MSPNRSDAKLNDPQGRSNGPARKDQSRRGNVIDSEERAVQVLQRIRDPGSTDFPVWETMAAQDQTKVTPVIRRVTSNSGFQFPSQ